MSSSISTRTVPAWTATVAFLAGLFLALSPVILEAQVSWADSIVREHTASMAAHHICSGTFVVGRDHQRPPAQVLEEDVRPFSDFNWQDDFRWEVDEDGKTASVWADGLNRRTARFLRVGGSGAGCPSRDDERESEEGGETGGDAMGIGHRGCSFVDLRGVAPPGRLLLS